MARLARALVGLLAIAGLLLAWPILTPGSAPPPLAGLVGEWARYLDASGPEQSPVRIAVAVDAGERGEGGPIVRGVRTLVDRVNAEGGISGRPLAIDLHDDGGNADAGRTIAEWIATETEAVAVVGHRQSAVTRAAGEIYADYGVPVVTPTATAPGVTPGNPWSFRTIHNDDFLGAFLAHYVAATIDPAAALVVAGADETASGLADVFLDTAGTLGMTTSGPVVADGGAEAAGRVVERLRELPGPRVLFTALGGDEAVPFVRAVREAGLEDTTVIGLRPPGDASGAAVDAIGATPWLDQIAAGRGAGFRDAYLSRYGAPPDWRAAFAHDAAAAVVAAISRSGSAALGLSVADTRSAVRDQLAAMNGAATGAAGVTGPVFFDANGDSPKPPVIARYEAGRLVPTLVQFLAPVESESADRVRSLVEQGRAIEIGGQVLARTDVVVAGVTIDAIRDIGRAGATAADLAGDLWFRSARRPAGEAGAAAHGDDRPAGAGIVFLNAVDEVSMRRLETATGARGDVYTRYRFEGRFRFDAGALPGHQEAPRLGVAFRHESRPAARLIYVADRTGMGLDDGAGRERLAPRLAAAGLKIAGAAAYQDVHWLSARGDPRASRGADGLVPYSAMVAAIELSEAASLAGFGVPGELRVPALLLGAALFLVAWAMPLGRRGRAWMARCLIQMLGLAVLLLAGENAALAVLADAAPARTALVGRGFDALWWLVGAGYLLAAVNGLVWPALEARAGRAVPTAARRAVRRLVILAAAFGALALALDLPALGVVGGIVVLGLAVGLAIQADLSNVVAGLRLRSASRFALGDWVRMGSLPAARIEDVTWHTTHLAGLDGHRWTLTNREAARAAIENLSASRPLRDSITLYIAADVPPATVMALIKDALERSAQIDRDRGYGATLLGLEVDAQMLMKYVAWYYLPDFGTCYEVRQEIWLNIWERLESEGVSVPGEAGPEADVPPAPDSDRDAAGAAGDVSDDRRRSA